MLNHLSEERRRYNRRLWQVFIITNTGFWLTVMIWIWMLLPIFAPGVWPLLDLPRANHGHKALDRESDLFVSITSSGAIFLDEEPVTLVNLEQRLSQKRQGWDRKLYQPEVFFRVDRSARFGAVRRAIRAAQNAGRRHVVVLVATPPALEWN